jgi:hypothetical protein
LIQISGFKKIRILQKYPGPWAGYGYASDSGSLLLVKELDKLLRKMVRDNRNIRRISVLKKNKTSLKRKRKGEVNYINCRKGVYIFIYFTN